MADTAIAITAGSGTNVDTRTEATNGNHRQVIVVGDPSTNAGVAPVDATNGLSVTLTTALPAGTAAIGKLAANSGVDIGDVDVASVAGNVTVVNAGTFAVQATVAAAATNIAKAEDVASADADVGVPAMAVRKATPANTSGADGDYEMIQMSAGRLWTSAVVDTALPAGTNNIGDVDIASAIPAGTNNIGDVDVASIAAGDNNIGNVDIVTMPDVTLGVGNNNIGDVDIASIAAGNNNIGDVDVASLPALASGSNIIGRVGHDQTGIGDGRKVVTSAGTAEALAGSTTCKRVILSALFENTGIVVVGTSTVVAASGTRRGMPLNPADTIEIDIDNLADIFLDVTVSGEGVSYIYFT